MEANGKKNLAIGMLVAAICIMAIGYAALAQTLTINGTAEITGTWDVHLQNVQQTVDINAMLKMVLLKQDLVQNKLYLRAFFETF